MTFPPVRLDHAVLFAAARLAPDADAGVAATEGATS